MKQEFKELIKYPHPNLGRFINKIQKEEEITRVKYVECRNGDTIHFHRKNYIFKEKHMFDYIMTYN